MLPGLGNAPHRVSVDLAAPPWSAVARLQVPGVSRCTAVFITDRVAVTAAHCLYGRRLGHFVPPGSVHVLLGYDAGRFVRHEVAVSYRIAPGYDPQETGGAAADVALVVFAAPVARAVPLLDPDPAPGTAVTVGGYGQDRAEQVLADPSCRVIAAGPLLTHDCAATRGTSGGPVFTRTPDGWRLAGIEIAARRDGIGGVAVPASAIKALLVSPSPPGRGPG